MEKPFEVELILLPGYSQDALNCLLVVQLPQDLRTTCWSPSSEEGNICLTSQYLGDGVFFGNPEGKEVLMYKVAPSSRIRILNKKVSVQLHLV